MGSALRQVHAARFPDSGVVDGSTVPECESGGRRGQWGLYNQWIMESSPIEAPSSLQQQQQQPRATAERASLQGGLPPALLSTAMEDDGTGGGAAVPAEHEGSSTRRSLDRRVHFSVTEEVCEVCKRFQGLQP